MQNNPQSEETLADLALECLDQLEREESNLLETIECLEAIRRCAINSDLETLSTLLQSHQELQNTSEGIADARKSLRLRLASALDVPEKQVTIRRFSQIAPSQYAERLTNYRQRLIPLVNQANLLGQSIVMLVRQSMDLMREFLECFTGQHLNDSYSRSGNPVDSQNKSLLQFRC
jgi:hypothetical protein